ncbi:MAG: hypothetical protein U1G07_10780 [Verrucomicrobiota bacterium]
MSEPQYLVGIDLGTIELRDRLGPVRVAGPAGVIDLPIPQVRRLGEIGSKPPCCLPVSTFPA